MRVAVNSVSYISLATFFAAFHFILIFFGAISILLTTMLVEANQGEAEMSFNFFMIESSSALVGIVVLPVLSALWGFVLGLVCALIFNVIAALFGGLKIELARVDPKPE